MIIVRNLTIRMDGLAILSDASFNVERGELALLAGDSGSGKSTLLQVLGGLHKERPDLEVDGEILVEGVDVLSAKPGEIARVAGQVFQHAEDQLLALDVEGEVSLKLENLGVQPREGAPLVVETLSRFGLLGHERRESHRLSGGEAKRVALAQALSNNPPVLLMDEPLTGLSPRWRDRLLDDLTGVAGTVTALVAEHRARFVAPFADRAYYLGEGRLVGIEPDLLAAQPEEIPAVPPRAARTESAAVRLAFDDVHMHRDDRPVLDGVRFQLRGGFVALVGENGAGKTTLLESACGLIPLIAGSVRVNELDPHTVDARTLTRSVGCVPQHAAHAFTCDTVRDELALTPRRLGLPDADERVDREILRWNLLLQEATHPLSLSGGERQRLAFACALVHAPPVLLLDEPTVGLDPPTLKVLLDVIREAAADGLVVAATHDERLLDHADHVVEVENGRLHGPRPVEAVEGVRE